ncbi:MAG: hypothetical protein ACXIUM_09800 [Wenzhouxiangella sp.]
MKINAYRRWAGPALIGLGVALLLAAVLSFLAGLSARQSVAAAERQAQAHASELAEVLLDLQARLDSAAVERSALALLGRAAGADQALLDALDAAGLAPVLTAQVFSSDLEELALGEYPEPDFTTLEMLLEARRSGRALPEGRVLPAQPAHVALARSIGPEAQRLQGLLLVRVPIDNLIAQVSWSSDLDFVALSQGLGERSTEVWRQGNRPSQDVARSAVPETRFWLEWHRSTSFPLVGLREASILGLAGIIALLFGLRVRSPALDWVLPLPAGASSWVAKLRARLPARGESSPAVEPDQTDELAAVDAGASPGANSPAATPVALHQAPKAAVTEPPAPATASGLSPPPPLNLDFPASPVSTEPAAQQTSSASLDQTDGPEPPLEAAVAPETSKTAEPMAEPSAAPAPKVEPELELELDPEPEPQPQPELDPEPKPKPKKTPQPSAANRPRAAARSVPRSAPVEVRLFTDAGILGRYEAGLDERSVTLIGQAIAEVAGERGVRQIVVARDGRLHGAVLIAALTQGLRSGGLDVLELGAVPSPLLDFAALELPGQSAVMVSAGHLPADWNGLRIMLQGELLVGERVHDLLHRLCQPAAVSRTQGALETASVLERYVRAVTTRIQLERPLKIVVDCANGVSGLLMPRLLEAIGADVVPLYADIDGGFPNHLPDPSRLENLEDLRLCVRNFRADLGLAVGGDGDRVVMVGPDGSILWPDRMLMLLAGELLERHPGAVIVQDALCSPRVAKALSARGASVQISDLGPAGVASALRAGDGQLGATFAGQFLLPGDWNVGGDALFGACRLLEILAADTREVADVLAELPSWHSLPPSFLPTRPAAPELVLDQLLESADVSEAEVGNAHGFSIDTGKAWTRICRSADGSGLLIRFEGDDEIAVQRLRALVRQLLLVVDERLQIPF